MQDRQKIRDSWVALRDNRNVRDDGAKRIPYCCKVESMELIVHEWKKSTIARSITGLRPATVFEARFGFGTAASDWSGIPAGLSKDHGIFHLNCAVLWELRKDSRRWDWYGSRRWENSFLVCWNDQAEFGTTMSSQICMNSPRVSASRCKLA